MYIQGFLLAVPEDRKDAYRGIAEKFWEIAKDYGALSLVESWEVDVKDGEVTDFHRAVMRQPGEKVVFSWIIWKDRATCEASHAAMIADPRFEALGTEMPFDGKRMVFGGFEPLVVRDAR